MWRRFSCRVTKGHWDMIEWLFHWMCDSDKVLGAGSVASAKAQLDWSCVYKAKAGIFQKGTVWANTAKIPFEAWYKLYVMALDPELAMVGMHLLWSCFCVLVWAKLVCSRAQPLEDQKQAGACNHWKACVGLLTGKQQNAASSNADELEMLAWDYKVHSCSVTVSDSAAHAPARWSRPWWGQSCRMAESRVAHFSWVAE